MAGYYNPYAFYPNYQAPQNTAPSYMNSGYQMPMTQNTPTVSQTIRPMEWVEGEVGAKAFQMPNGWYPNQPIPLWDSTDTIIYLKSWSQMGIPNPLQKIHYTLPDQQSQQMLPAQSGQTEETATSNFVTKDDFDAFKTELKEMLKNQNGGRTQQRYKQEDNHG